MIRFNLPGLLMGLICGVVWGTLLSLGVSDALAAYVMIGVMFVLDVGYRWRNGEEKAWDKWFAGKSGGFLGITPVWITAVILLALFQFGVLDL